MQNFDLLKRLGQVDRPILLKRGLNVPTKNGSCQPNILWLQEMKTLSCASVVFVHLKHIQETLLTYRAFLYFAKRHIFLL